MCGSWISWHEAHEKERPTNSIKYHSRTVSNIIWGSLKYVAVESYDMSLMIKSAPRTLSNIIWGLTNCVKCHMGLFEMCGSWISWHEAHEKERPTNSIIWVIIVGARRKRRYCSALQHIATHCNALHRTTPHGNARQHTQHAPHLISGASQSDSTVHELYYLNFWILRTVWSKYILSRTLLSIFWIPRIVWSKPHQKLLGDGVLTPVPLFFLICTLSRTKRVFLISTRTRPRSYQPGPSWFPGSTPMSFQEVFCAVLYVITNSIIRLFEYPKLYDLNIHCHELYYLTFWIPKTVWSKYGVATIRRLLKIIGLFCNRAL